MTNAASFYLKNLSNFKIFVRLYEICLEQFWKKCSKAPTKFATNCLLNLLKIKIYFIKFKQALPVSWSVFSKQACSWVPYCLRHHVHRQAMDAPISNHANFELIIVFFFNENFFKQIVFLLIMRENHCGAWKNAKNHIQN